LSFSQTQISNISYNIQADIDIKNKIVKGSEIIAWKNNTNDFITTIQIHLYHNAYKNSNSTYAQGKHLKINQKHNGYTDITSIEVLDNLNNIVKTEFIQPDDNNIEDQTVYKIELAKPILPNQEIKLHIDFLTKIPISGIGRSGYGREKNVIFVSEWYPKLGVYKEGKGWDSHQFHSWAGFYSNFASYNIKLTIPDNYSISASLLPAQEEQNSNNTKTLTYKSNYIIDFAWCITKDYIEYIYEHEIKNNNIKVSILLQKENQLKIDRIFSALKNCINDYSDWVGNFPFESITIIDLPKTFNIPCSFYPSLIGIHVNFFEPIYNYSIEEKIIHSLGHQYFSSAISVNQIAEPWIDESIIGFLTGRILQKHYGAGRNIIRFADGIPFDGIPILTHRDFPIVVYPSDAPIDYIKSVKNEYLKNPNTDPINQNSWKYLNSQTYTIGTLYKPVLMMETIARYFEYNNISRAIKSFYNNYLYRYPQANNWTRIIRSIYGKNIVPFIEPILYGTEIIDNSVESIKNYTYIDNQYIVEVVFSRTGAIKLTADLAVYLEDGTIINDSWNCEEKWIKKTYICSSPGSKAVIDPHNKIVLDVNTSNNSYVIKSDYKPIFKWTSQWLFWMQNLLQMLSSIC
jgi:hypothetical protein